MSGKNRENDKIKWACRDLDDLFELLTQDASPDQEGAESWNSSSSPKEKVKKTLIQIKSQLQELS